MRSLFVAVEPINEALLPVFPNVPALMKDTSTVTGDNGIAALKLEGPGIVEGRVAREVQFIKEPGGHCCRPVLLTVNPEISMLCCKSNPDVPMFSTSSGVVVLDPVIELPVDITLS